MCLGSYSVRQSRSTILLLDRILTEQDPRHTLYQSAAWQLLISVVATLELLSTVKLIFVLSKEPHLGGRKMWLKAITATLRLSFMCWTKLILLISLYGVSFSLINMNAFLDLQFFVFRYWKLWTCLLFWNTKRSI